MEELLIQLLQENKETKYQIEELQNIIQKLKSENEDLRTRIYKNTIQYKNIFHFLQQKNETLLKNYIRQTHFSV